MMIKRWVLLSLISFVMIVGQAAAQDTPTERVLAVSTVPVLEPPLTAENAIERYTDAMRPADDTLTTYFHDNLTVILAPDEYRIPLAVLAHALAGSFMWVLRWWG